MNKYKKAILMGDNHLKVRCVFGYAIKKQPS